MRPESHHIGRIIAYLEGRLPLDELKVFETKLASDPALKMEVELQPDLR